MIFRIYPHKDTFISNVLLRGVPQTGSNYGRAESLQVFKLAGTSGALGVLSGSQVSRALLRFDTASLDDFVSANNLSSRPRFFYLRMQDETTSDGVPSSFDIEVLPVSGAWDEGRGMDVAAYRDKGAANWWKRTSADYWVSRGGDFHTVYGRTQHMDQGDESIDLDVTSFFSLWASGSIANDGICVRLTSSLESDAVYTDYFRKTFYSRHSGWPDRRPYVEVRWNDFIGDDRGRMSWNKTGSLFFYNIVDGVFQNVSADQLIVSIADLSGALMSVTASNAGMVGVYSASFALPSGSYSGSVFFDRWGSGSFALMTGSFSFHNAPAYSTLPDRQYIARIVNLREEYDPEDVVRFDVFVRQKNYHPAVVQTASLDVRPQIIETCYYCIENDSTRERVVPFGTGSLQHTRLSYDANGNYFVLPMSALSQGEVYRVLFLVQRDGYRQVLDNSVRFRVR